MSLEMPCAAWMVFAACILYDWPGTMGLWGAHDVTSLATLESSSECSR